MGTSEGSRARRGTSPEALPAGQTPIQAVGADQVSLLTPFWLVLLLAVGITALLTTLFVADYWVWVPVSIPAAFEAVAAESNVGLAIGAFFAIWSTSGDSRNTRQMLRQMEEQHMEIHRSISGGPNTQAETSSSGRPEVPATHPPPSS